MGLFDGFDDLFDTDNDDMGIAAPSEFLPDPFTSFSLCSDDDTSSSITDSFMDDMVINPASGLPMISGSFGLDIQGNPYGTSSDDWTSCSISSTSTSPIDDD